MVNGKMTKKDWFEKLVVLVENADMEVEEKEGVLAFLNNEMDLLNRKYTNAKETPTEKANSKIMDTILEVLADSADKMSIPDMMKDSRLQTYTEVKSNGEVTTKDITNQKMSALLKKLKDAGKVIRTEEKKKAYFELAIVDNQ